MSMCKRIPFCERNILEELKIYSKNLLQANIRFIKSRILMAMMENDDLKNQLNKIF